MLKVLKRRGKMEVCSAHCFTVLTGSSSYLQPAVWWWHSIRLELQKFRGPVLGGWWHSLVQCPSASCRHERLARYRRALQQGIVCWHENLAYCWSGFCSWINRWHENLPCCWLDFCHRISGWGDNTWTFCYLVFLWNRCSLNEISVVILRVHCCEHVCTNY